MSRVIILSGLPGSGKSYLAEQLRGPKYRDDFIICSADSFFVDENGKYKFDPALIGEAHAACLRKFNKYVSTPKFQELDMTIVVDNTNLTEGEIAPYYALASAYGHEVEIVFLACDTQEAFKRQVHGVPESTFMKMAETYTNLRPLPWWKFSIHYS